jgi:hypothetical protein
MALISLMRLKSTRLKKIFIATREGEFSDISDYAGKAKVSLNMHANEDFETMNFFLAMGLVLDWSAVEESPFKKISIDIEGVFTFPENTEMEVIPKYFPLLGVANLLGISRGILTNSTAMCDGGPYILPLFNVHELMKEAEKVGGKPERKKVKAKAKAAFKDGGED